MSGFLSILTYLSAFAFGMLFEAWRAGSLRNDIGAAHRKLDQIHASVIRGLDELRAKIEGK